ncbi:alpha/beta fold hydrolase [Carboxydochorda subterranea]|uniref:Alpha/beta fold hydrolase n=1 Tax=Carboxydichorda subterranea TaxID=3109565 RepID=A0ABZ1C3U1_9FIRM|nr:alpha/beta fold hydrolase [Limnochorda sp. L945t]WRP18772.1 alpha/beta fold hydrolase [Limnochorda sp. L945t]
MVLIGGSGPQDMDATIFSPWEYGPQGPVLLSHIFKDAADHLAGCGVASVRYNKRYVAGPGQFDTQRFEGLTLGQMLEDAEAVLNAARAHPLVDPHRIFVYGWSEGSTVATALAARHPELAGLILQAPVVGAWRDVFVWQAVEVGLPYLKSFAVSGRITGESLQRAFAGDGGLAAKLAASFAVDPSFFTTQTPAVHRFLDTDGDGALALDTELTPARFEQAIDAALGNGFLAMYAPDRALPPVMEQASRLRMPVLILQGERDASVPPAQARILAEALRAQGNADVTLKWYPELGHSLGKTPSTVQDDFQPIDAAPLQDVCAWVSAVAARPAPARQAASEGLTQNPTPQAALERLFRQRPVQAEWFAPGFLAVLPVSQIEAIVDELVRNFGQLQEVRREAGKWLVVLERGELPTHVQLDAQGRFEELMFEPPRSREAIGLDRAVAEMDRLAGKVSLIVVEDGRERAALRPDQPMGVASAFKLAVLAALREQVEAGRWSWDTVVRLRPEWRSLPSGFLQTWPGGAPLTLYSLAALMVSQSDNTAADALLALVGREAVEAISPRNRPFLSTREMFILKARGNEALRARFRSADEGGRYRLVEEMAGMPLPSEDAFGPEPTALDIEWFFTTRELCALMDRVRDLPFMGINPGVARAEQWAQVAFKGGSEPGVLNLTTALVSKDGRHLCVSATWNSPDKLADQQFMSLYSGLLEALK